MSVNVFSSDRNRFRSRLLTALVPSVLLANTNLQNPNACFLSRFLTNVYRTLIRFFEGQPLN